MLPGGAPFNSRPATSAVSRLRSAIDSSDPPTAPAPRYTLNGENIGALAVA